ncbi:ACP S-malonyltransferase [Paraclostridium bifermentans]|uniref:ACP S-malonyltransferase n=1 Tax=Paraclostridium bifermentans TaxID=1490 RepID=UPI00290E76D9|nr:ACP S-malonyltransferase [Paraclostridium bifermentans]MDU3338021.1 ACP S-malonyltransferase [Paraclostridium bifermentans]
MKRFAFLFPGQGSQHVGMGNNLYKTDMSFRTIIDDASKILNEDLNYILNDLEKLNKTRYAQVTISIISFAYFQKFINEYKVVPTIMAGHSLGEISALTAAGIISFKDSLFILKKRGELMEDEASNNNGKMIAVMNTNKEDLINLCAKITNEGDYIDIANYNGNNQIVVSGTRSGIEKIEEQVKLSNGIPIPLKVNGAFHSNLMKNASKYFNRYISSFCFFQPCINVISSVDCELYSKDKVVNNLSKQIYSPVQWTSVIEKLIADGVKVFVEAGPKNVLTNMISRDYPDVKCISLEKMYKNNENFWDYME